MIPCLVSGVDQPLLRGDEVTAILHEFKAEGGQVLPRRIGSIKSAIIVRDDCNAAVAGGVSQLQAAFKYVNGRGGISGHRKAAIVGR